MQLYFIRHGQSANNALWSANGSGEGRSDDPGLTEVGRRQAAHAADFLACGRGKHRMEGSEAGDDGDGSSAKDVYGTNFHGFHLTHLYSSLMLRAVETGSIIAERIGLPLLGWIDIHECGGVYLDVPESGGRVGRPGGTRSRLEEAFPALVVPGSASEHGWWNRPFEEEADRTWRVTRVAEELLVRHAHTADRVGIITHGEFYSRLLGHLLGVRSDVLLWFTLNNTGMTRVDITPEYVNVVYQNRIEFLPEDLVT